VEFVIEKLEIYKIQFRI